MKEYKFEDFLAEKHAENYIGLDDDMPDAFDHWVSNLDGEQLINYADIFGLKLASMHINDMRERIKL